MSQDKRRHISELTFGQGLAFGGLYDPDTGLRKTPMQIKRMIVRWNAQNGHRRPKPSSDRMAVGE